MRPLGTNDDTDYSLLVQQPRQGGLCHIDRLNFYILTLSNFPHYFDDLAHG